MAAVRPVASITKPLRKKHIIKKESCVEQLFFFALTPGIAIFSLNFSSSILKVLANQLYRYLIRGSYSAYLLALMLGLYFISLNVTGFQFQFFPGDFIDGRFNNYLLEHAHLFFTGQISEFWNAPFMYPEAEVISYSDNLLGTAPFYSCFRLMGCDRESAFQYWYLLITVLNFTGAYVLIKYILKNSYAAACGAMIFAFSMALHCQMGHAQTFTRFPMMLCVLAALKFAEELEVKWFFITVLGVVYQLYCGIYLGFLLLFPASVLLLSIFIKRRVLLKEKLKHKKWTLSLCASLLLNVVLLMPLMIPYLKRALQLGFYDYHQIVSTVPTPLSYFSSWGGSLFWDALGGTTVSYPAYWDHLLFSGAFATLGLLYFLFIKPFTLFSSKAENKSLEKMHMQLLWLTALFTFLFFLRIQQTSLYRVLFALPGYGSMRALQRIINFELIFFALGVAYLLRFIFTKKSVLSFFVFVLVAGLIIADNYVKPDFMHHKSKLDSKYRVEALVQKMKHLPKNTLVSYEPDSLVSSPMDYQLDGMLAAQSLGLKTLNGYSATSPGGYGDYWVKPCEKSRQIWLERKGMNSLQPIVIK